MLADMIFQRLLDYGALGILIILMIYYLLKQDKREENREKIQREDTIKLSEVVQNNTIVLTTFLSETKRCRK